MKTPHPNAIEKALDILMAFSPNNHEMGTVEISKKTGFHIPTVNRTLKILAQRRFLQQNPKTKKFTLGPAIIGLGECIIDSLNKNLLPIALPYLNDLCDRARETVVLEVLSGMTGIIVYVAQGNQTLNIRVNVGFRVPIHASAGSKAIIAFSGEETIERSLKKKLRRYTKKTITDPAKLRLDLSRVRERGVAFSREEMNEGVNAIGAPILNHENTAVAAVTLVGPSSRIKCSIRSPIVIDLKNTASEIAGKLLHSESLGTGS